MKARIRSAMYSLEFSGSPAIWNDFFRPLIGGPRAPDEPSEAEAAEAAGAVSARQSASGRPVLAPGPLRPALGVPGPLSPGAGRPYPDDTYGSRGYGDRGRGFEQRREGDRGPERGSDAFSQRGPQRGDARSEGSRSAGPRPSAAPVQKPRRVRPQATGPQIEKTANPEELYARLGEVEGRRGEKDAVLAAVWFASGGTRSVTAEDVEKHLEEHGWDAEVRVRPHLQKHVTRSKLLDAGEESGTFRMNRKGTSYVVEMLVGE